MCSGSLATTAAPSGYCMTVGEPPYRAPVTTSYLDTKQARLTPHTKKLHFLLFACFCCSPVNVIMVVVINTTFTAGRTSRSTSSHSKLFNDSKRHDLILMSTFFLNTCLVQLVLH